MMAEGFCFFLSLWVSSKERLGHMDRGLGKGRFCFFFSFPGEIFSLNFACTFVRESG